MFIYFKEQNVFQNFELTTPISVVKRSRYISMIYKCINRISFSLDTLFYMSKQISPRIVNGGQCFILFA
jgi:hypothetical protein